MLNIKTVSKIIVSLMFCLIMTGCGKIFVPYETKPLCAPAPVGTCAKVTNAYGNSVAKQRAIENGATGTTGTQKEAGKTDNEKSKCESGHCNSDKEKPKCESGHCDKTTESPATVTEIDSTSNGQSISKNIYMERKFEHMAALVGEEAPPVVVPPEIVRVLILSYEGDEKEMYGYRYAYFFGTDPKWVLSTAVEEGVN